MIAQGRTAALALLILLPAAGCGAASDPDDVTVAEVTDGRITRAQLEYYFKSNLLEETGDEPLPADEMNTVRSRLLDALIEERILLAEADLQGIRVADAEIEAYLAQGEPDPDPAGEAEARRRLRLEKLQAKIAHELPPIEDLVPHRGESLLLDCVLEHDDESTVARVVVGSRKCLEKADGTIAPWVALEYMSQCIAAHESLLAAEDGGSRTPGYLTAAVGVRLHRSRFEVGEHGRANVRHRAPPLKYCPE